VQKPLENQSDVTKQTRDQGMLEKIQYRNRDEIKEKRVRIVWEVFEEEGRQK